MLLKFALRLGVLACGMIALTAAGPRDLTAAEPVAKKSESGTLVSYRDGALTLRGKSGDLVYEVGSNFKTWQNNEEGPGSKHVDTVQTLSQAAPGTVVRLDAENREVFLGLDYREIGIFESYQDGKLQLLAADVPPGFVQKPEGKLVLAIDPGIPVLESVEGAPYRYRGPAGEVLKHVKKGTQVTARSEYDVEHFEVIQLGEPRQKIERYVGQTRGTVRGTLVSFRDGILRIRGKGTALQAAKEYERLINLRVADSVPIVESIDGDPYRPADLETLKAAKEGAVITVRKIEEVLLEIQIGVAK